MAISVELCLQVLWIKDAQTCNRYDMLGRFFICLSIISEKFKKNEADQKITCKSNCLTPSTYNPVLIWKNYIKLFTILNPKIFCLSTN